MTDPIVGIDLGGTNMQIGVVNADGEVTTQIKKKTRAEQGADAVFERLVKGVQRVCMEGNVSVDSLAGIGLAAAGAVDSEAGVILDAPNLGFRDFPIADALKDRLGVPVILENDVNAALIGEHRFGAVRGENEALGVWVGTGVGGAIVLNGALHRGALGSAGEIGHMTLFPKAERGARILEDTCSRSAIVRRLATLAASGRPTSLTDLAPDGIASIKSRIISQAYTSGDPLTCEVVDEAADLLGTAIAGVVTLLAIPVVVLGGGLVEAMGEKLVDRVRKSVHEHVFPRSLTQVRVVEGELCDKAGILGAWVVASDFFLPHG